MSGWRKRLGARLLVERVQVKDWNVAKAARETGVSQGVINRIEHGENYEVAMLEKYAAAYGKPLESWIREVLAVPDDILNQIADWSQKPQSPRKAKGG